MALLNFPNRVDTVEQLYPARPVPNGQNDTLALSVAAEQKFQGQLAIRDAHSEAVGQAHASDEMQAANRNIRGILTPQFDTLDMLVNYGETVEEAHHFNMGWVLTAVTLLPGIQANGTVHNPNVLFIDGLPRIHGGNGIGGSSRLAIPFDTKPVDCILEIPVQGRLYLHLSVQAASPGAMMVFPRAVLRFQNWENGMPLEGGNQ